MKRIITALVGALLLVFMPVAASANVTDEITWAPADPKFSCSADGLSVEWEAPASSAEPGGAESNEGWGYRQQGGVVGDLGFVEAYALEGYTVAGQGGQIWDPVWELNSIYGELGCAPAQAPEDEESDIDVVVVTPSPTPVPIKELPATGPDNYAPVLMGSGILILAGLSIVFWRRSLRPQ